MSAAEKLDTTKPHVVWLRHDQLKASPHNPRKHARTAEEIAELALSIADKGILQNLVARKAKGGVAIYEIAAGEGRWRAVTKLIADKHPRGNEPLPVLVRDLSDEQMIEIGLIENGQRNDLHPLDEAKAFLALYEARTGSKAAKGTGDKNNAAAKAAGDVVRTLAAQMGRTDRYVQLRLQMARNLQPKAIEKLEKGTLNLVVAQELSKRTPEEQRRFFSQNPDWKIAQMRQREVVEHFAGNWRLLSSAIFEPGAYKGPTEEVDGKLYATDAKAFDLQQRVAADRLRGQSLKDAKAGKIAFFEENEYFYPRDGDYTFKKVDGKPDPKGGIVLKRNRHDGTIEVFRGLFKTKAKLAHDTSMSRWKASEARARAQPKRKTDPRMKASALHLITDAGALMAIELHNALTRWGDSISWINIGGYLSDKHKAPVVDALKKLGKFEAHKGAELLKWLLSKGRAELAPAWCALQMSRLRIYPIVKASKADLVLFDHCGVKPIEPKSKPKAKGKAK